MEIHIRRQWNDYNIATTQLACLQNLHWSSISGGVYARAPQLFVHGYVNCELIDGEISHSCRHTPKPHDILVCIVKKDNTTEAWKEILKIVGPKPKKS